MSAFSLVLGLSGTAGLPHIMMRFFTQSQRQRGPQVGVLTPLASLVCSSVTMVLGGAAAISIVGTNPAFFEGGQVGNQLIMAATCRSCIWQRPLAATSSRFPIRRCFRHHPRRSLRAGSGRLRVGDVSRDLYARVIKKGRGHRRAGNASRALPPWAWESPPSCSVSRSMIKTSSSSHSGIRRRVVGEFPGAHPVRRTGKA